MNTLKCIKFGREAAQSHPDLSLAQFTRLYAENHQLRLTNTDLLCTLASTSSDPESHLVSYLTLIQYGILPRRNAHDTKKYFNAYGIDFKEDANSGIDSHSRLMLSWSGIVSCFKMVNKTMQYLIQHAPILYIAYDAYEQQLVFTKAMKHIITLEDRIQELNNNNESVVYPIPIIPESPEYYVERPEYPEYEWDDFLNQMVRVSTI